MSERIVAGSPLGDVHHLSYSTQEGAVAKVVICPSCQSKGSIPDESKAARIRCPKCGEMFDVKGASGGPPSGTSRKPGSSAGPKPAAAPRPSAFADLESVQPLPPVANSGSRRSVAAGQPTRGQGKSPMLFAVVGIGSVAVLLLIGLLFFVMRGNGNAGDGGGAGVVQNQPPEPIQPAAPAPAPAIDATSPATASTAPSTPAAPINAVADAQEIIRKLKESTVYIIAKLGDKPVSTGSGFVIEAFGDTVVIATNRHVAVVDTSELPTGLAKDGAKPSLEVVLRSGLGPQEEAHPADILAADLSQEYGNDLAFLVARGVKKLPPIVNIISKSDASEGATYIGAGFPLGGMLNKISESKGNPSVTITCGGVG
jgi:hypothetical protein